MISRRTFLGAAASAPAALRAQQRRRLPVGLELYSVDKDLRRDFPGTIRAVAAMDFACVEFIPIDFDMTAARAREVRSLLDDVGLKCFSTRNWEKAFTPEGLDHAIEINRILGSSLVVLTTSAQIARLDGWKAVAESLNRAAVKLRPAGMRTGFHNHPTAFQILDGGRPADLLAAETTRDVAFEFDAGNCVSAGCDPVAWIEKNPGRFPVLHVKDWSSNPGRGFRVLLGEGVVPWQKILAAAEKSGGVEYYLIEQEGSDYPPMETAKRSLSLYRKLYG
jgi:sugar phosphate isomerase/epimerase